MNRKKKTLITLLALGLLIAIALVAVAFFNRDYAKRVGLTTIKALTEIKEAIYQPDFQITHGPYICSMNEKGDLYVVWTTNRPAVSWVELTSTTTGETIKAYETLAGLNRSTKTLHTIKLSNLLPDTKYTYEIHSKENKGVKHNTVFDFGDHISSKDWKKKPYEFKTFSDSTDSCSFVVLNDIHGSYDLMEKLCEGVDFEKSDFVMFNGDMVGAADSEDVLFAEYIDTAIDQFASETPIIWGHGNHEINGAYADFMLDYFPNVYNRYYYMFKVGNIAFLVLDSGEYVLDAYWDQHIGTDLARFEPYRREEAKWIAQVTENDEFKNADYRIVFMHICPLYGQSSIKKELHEVFTPVLQNANIDLMLSGHHHDYAYHPANEQINFPVIINGDESLLKCDVTKDHIQITIKDLKLNKTIEHRFDKKK